MAAFRLLNQFPVYLDNEGQPAALGYLRFYESGTTTDKAVYSDAGLSQSSGARVDLDSAGRTESDVWGDGSYRVRLYGADDVMIAEADDVEVAGGTGTTIPAMVDGYFLTNNGGLLLWAPIREVPDPTGQSGKMLTNDGSNLNWTAVPSLTIPTLDAVVSTSSLRIAAGTTSFLIQMGDDSAPASNDVFTQKSVTFPTAYVSTPFVFVTPRNGGVTPHGYYTKPSVLDRSQTGFTFSVHTGTGESNSNASVTDTVDFSWVAFGTIVTPT